MSVMLNLDFSLPLIFRPIFIRIVLKRALCLIHRDVNIFSLWKKSITIFYAFTPAFNLKPLKPSAPIWASLQPSYQPQPCYFRRRDGVTPVSQLPHVEEPFQGKGKFCYTYGTCLYFTATSQTSLFYPAINFPPKGIDTIQPSQNAEK